MGDTAAARGRLPSEEQESRPRGLPVAPQVQSLQGFFQRHLGTDTQVALLMCGREKTAHCRRVKVGQPVPLSRSGIPGEAPAGQRELRDFGAGEDMVAASDALVPASMDQHGFQGAFFDAEDHHGFVSDDRCGQDGKDLRVGLQLNGIARLLRCPGRW